MMRAMIAMLGRVLLVATAVGVYPCVAGVSGTAGPSGTPEALTRFDSWMERYLVADPGEKSTLEAEGVRLAEQRRPVLADLIRAQPHRALTLALSPEQLAALPAAIRRLAERHVAGRASSSMFSPGHPESSATAPEVVIRGQAFRIHLYGRRTGQDTFRHTPLYGVAIGGDLAVAESPIRIPSAGNRAASTLGASQDGGITAEVGGIRRVLADTAELAALEQALVAAEPRPRSAAAAAAGDSTQDVTVRLAFDAEDVVFGVRDGYDTLHLQGGSLPQDEPGLPCLPARYVNVLLPAGAVVTNVTAEFTEILLRSGVTPLPVQPPAPTSADRPAFAKPAADAYALDRRWPAAVVQQADRATRRRGWTSVPLRVNPVRYHAAAKAVYLTREITITVQCRVPSAAPLAPARHRAAFRTLTEKSMVNALFDAASPDYATGAEGAAARADADVLTAGAADGDEPLGNCDYLIITSAALVDAFQALADHRAAFNGFNAEVITTAHINTNYTGIRPDGGTDQQTRIRECITDYVQNRGTLYVLLGGDDTVVPDRNCYVAAGEYTETGMPTDLYYAGLDGTWDDDADGTYGEANYSGLLDEGDLAADVFVGRLPIRTAAQAANYIGKVIDYDTDLPPDIVGRFMMGGVKCWDTYSDSQRPTDTMYDGHAQFTDSQHTTVTDSEIWSRRAYKDCVYTNGWQASTIGCTFDTLTSWDTTSGGDYPVTSANLVTRFSEGWNFLTYATHGSISGWAAESGTFGSTQAASLTGPAHIVYTIACDSGAFDNGEPSLSEAFLRNGAGGALIYCGCSRYGWGSPGSFAGGTSMDYMRAFLTLVFQDGSAKNVGETFTVHKEAFAAVSAYNGAARWVQFGMNLQGDPALDMLPSLPTVTFEHTPVANSFDTNTAYDINAEVSARFHVPDDRLALYWNTTGTTNAFLTNSLQWVSNDLFSASIPAQTNHTDVYYYLAFASNGFVTVHPDGAPGTLHHFEVTAPVDLVVSGTPGSYGGVTPPYGTNRFATGNTVEALAWPDSPTNGTRYAPAGWSGAGSAPSTGATNVLSFTITTHSVLEWEWERQYALTQTSSVPGLLAADTWWTASATARTETAADVLTTNDTRYRFAHWLLQGARMPDPSNTALNPITGLSMDTTRVAVAHYLPEAQDGNTNAIADWWELRYLGSTNAPAGADLDGDTYSSLEEYADFTDPRDPTAMPAAPSIVHTPLSDPRPGPAPWPIQAAVTDNYSVAGVTLWWKRNADPWQSLPMPATGADGLYTNVLPGPGTNTDHFEYRIVATDPSGRGVTNGSHALDVAYPIAGYAADGMEDILLRHGTVTNVAISLTNSGTADLQWSINVGTRGLFADVESGTNGWSHSGQNDLWHVSTNRAFGGTHAWYCGDEAGGDLGQYTNSMDASLETPSVPLATSAMLTFRHWMSVEYDKDVHYWDGGVVELSTNGGTSFTQITPAGGYPHLITDNAASPFAADTPCYGGYGGWQKAMFDLSPYTGQDAVVRFRFGSDGLVVDAGWYIDDIMITPLTGTNAWLKLSATNGVLPGATSTGVVALLDSRTIRTGSRAAFVWLTSNDPLAPSNRAPVSIDVRSPPVASLSFAAQTATNGSGWVCLSNVVHDVDGESCGVSLEFSTNAGSSWASAWLADVRAGTGTPSLSNGTIRQVTAIPTTDGDETVTNRLTATWSTTNGPTPILLCTATWARVRIWDGQWWGTATTSQPFVVDNQAPTPPATLLVSSHTSGVWSTQRSISLSWPPADDGPGGGVRGYEATCTNGPGSARGGILTNCHAAFDAPADGTDMWVTVRAVDHYGNWSPPTATGAYWIDATAPTATNAQVSCAHAPAGDYVIGTVVTAMWSGFADPVSGVAGYYVAVADGSGTTNGAWTASPTATIGGLVPDRTNQVYVWARNAAGMIGSAVGAPVLALAGTTDFDGDGACTDDEQRAGTDATSADSVLAFEAIDSGPGPQLLVLRWDTVTNRTYSLLGAPCAASDPEAWLPLAGATNLPGTGGTLSCTTTVSQAAGRCYRLRVTPP